MDDACNFAWMEFMRYQPDRDSGWRAWLVTVAQREVKALWVTGYKYEEIRVRLGLKYTRTICHDGLS